MIAAPSTNGDVKAELSEQEQDQGAMEGKLIFTEAFILKDCNLQSMLS